MFFPLASRIFLQTHVWPILLREGKVSEIRLTITHHLGDKIPVLMNCQRTTIDGVEAYAWLFFVTTERGRYEQELLETRKRTESLLDETVKNTRFIRTLTDNFPNMIAYWDKNLICRFANLAYLQGFARPASEMIGITLQELLGEKLYAQSQPQISAVLSGEAQEFEREISKDDGSTTNVLSNYFPDRASNGEVQGFFVLITNITELRKADGQVRLLASVFNATSEGIMVTDANSNIRSINPAFSTLTGYSDEEVLGKPASILNSGRHDSSFFQHMYQQLRSSGEWVGQVWNKRKDGQHFLAKLTLSSIKNHAGAVSHYVGVFHDVTIEWERQEEIAHLALHDSLTKLPNRLLLMERLQQLLIMAQRQERRIAILFLDLDGFKEVNDSWGHDMGDHVLKTVASRLLQQIRSSDTAARLGGDEFVILLDQPDSIDDIAMIAARLIDEINKPIEWQGNPTTVGASIGIAIFQHGDIQAEQLLKQADTAMYQAKKYGKNRFHFSATIGQNS
ncbi:diguanylate cyclase domain-containing protein [Undibacterium sp. Ji22W]|uniref:diguanylate cyclase domain-containing protein n=1 Tax=Undibacterium sp. Ji22W TaxID=3413038 RepID=UPI003BF25422